MEGMEYTFNVFTEPERASPRDAIGAAGAFFAETLKATKRLGVAPGRSAAFFRAGSSEKHGTCPPEY